MSLKIVQHATCTFCGCVCDDIELHAEGDRIVKTKSACSLGESWFKNHSAERLYPDALIDGQPATVDAAVEARGRLPLSCEHALGLWSQQYHLRGPARGRGADGNDRRSDR